MSDRAPNGERRYLVVRGKSTGTRYALPSLGSLTVGSGASAEVRIEEPGVEADHAILFLDHGIGVRITEGFGAVLPAAAGRGGKERPLSAGETVDLEIGQVFRLGSAELHVAVTADAPAIARLLPRAAFERRLAEALVDDSAAGALLRLRVHGASNQSAVEDELAAGLRPGDVLTQLGGEDWAVLLTEVTESLVRALTADLSARLGKTGAEVLIGSAIAREARPDKLLELAAARLSRPGAGRDGIYISNDPEMLRVGKLVDRVAPSSTCVLILGETGTGKDLVAQQIHDRSPRAARPFVRVTCVELSDSAFEEGDLGFLDRARGGTVHLDEVGGLSARAQLALGAILEEAGSGVRDVRFVASSNQDLAALVAAGSFRKDLFFRLNQVTIDLPPLRMRQADILPLADLFIEAAAAAAGRPRAPALTPGAADLLSAHGWPGNIRELRNVVERAVLLSTGDGLGVEHLPADLAGGVPKEAPAEMPAEGGERRMSLREEITQLEKKRILEALRKHPTQRDAAMALEMPMRTFLNRLDALGIPRARGGGSKDPERNS